jgi:hypothetical protein
MFLGSDAELVRIRRDICAMCPHKQYVRLLSGMVGFLCRKCGCIVNLKTRFGGQRCPLGKW